MDHHTTKCFILKEKIMALVREVKITIDNGETNHDSVRLDHKKNSTSEALPLWYLQKLKNLSSCYKLRELNQLMFLPWRKQQTHPKYMTSLMKRMTILGFWSLTKGKNIKGLQNFDFKIRHKIKWNHFQQCEGIKFNIKLKCMNVSSQNVRRIVHWWILSPNSSWYMSQNYKLKFSSMHEPKLQAKMLDVRA